MPRRRLRIDERITPHGVKRIKLTPYERRAIRQSRKEEDKAVKDYKRRAKNSKNKSVIKTFKHVMKEEKTHSNEFNSLL